MTDVPGNHDHDHHLSDHHWTNWGGNQHVHPADLVTPTSEDELAALVSRGVAERRTVKVVGSGHSFTDIACADDGLMVAMPGFAGVLAVDDARHRVTVGAGTVLADLNRELAQIGLALPNLGDIDAQTVAGATATATHGTGAAFGSISAAIVGARLVTGDGGVMDIDEDHRPDLLRAVQVNLGALGIVTQLTLQCVPAFNLHAVDETLRVDDILERLDDVVAANDHVEFYWFPNTELGQLLVNNRTDDPVARRGRMKALIDDEVVANGAFGLLNRVGRRFPGVVAPTIARIMRPGDRTEYVAPSHEVFCSARRVRFVEMEYAIPREALHGAFEELRALVQGFHRPISFPIEVRVLGPDDTLLGTASGRDTAYIACHVYRGTPHEDYFRAAEAIMSGHDGRPHWGKMHYRDAASLAPAYPGWDTFQAALAELDPDGHFSNPYLDRVLRPSGFQSR